MVSGRPPRPAQPSRSPDGQRPAADSAGGKDQPKSRRELREREAAATARRAPLISPTPPTRRSVREPGAATPPTRRSARAATPGPAKSAIAKSAAKSTAAKTEPKDGAAPLLPPAKPSRAAKAAAARQSASRAAKGLAAKADAPRRAAKARPAKALPAKALPAKALPAAALPSQAGERTEVIGKAASIAPRPVRIDPSRRTAGRPKTAGSKTSGSKLAGSKAAAPKTLALGGTRRDPSRPATKPAETAQLPTVTLGAAKPGKIDKHGRRAAGPAVGGNAAQAALVKVAAHPRAAGFVVVAALVVAFAGSPIASAFRGMFGDDGTTNVVSADPSPNADPRDADVLISDPNPPSATTTQKPSQTATPSATRKAKAAASRSRTRTAAPTTKAPSSAAAGQAAKISGGVGELAKRSGLPWASGVYIPGSSAGKVEDFGAWRGRKVDVVVDWSARESWSDITNPTWLYDAWKGTPYTKSFGVAPIPEGDGSTLQACASGAYADKWRQFANNIKAAGLDDETFIRLGWEFNGDWYKWAANDPAAFAGCWRSVVTTVEAIAPKLRWDWNVNRGAGQSVEDAARAWPGDAYVDVVGIDSYDQWPGATNESSWKEQYSGKYGLKHWVDFAEAHGKKVSVPEWGVYPGAGSNGGDNAFYIAKMRAFFLALGDTLAYEAYFNESASYYGGSIFGPVQNPLAAAQYAALY